MQAVTIALYGGLGNQMFQYAMGRALTLKHHAALCLDTYGFEFDKKYQRSFELPRFNICAEAVILSKPLLFRSSRVLRKLSELSPIMRRIGGKSLLVEASPDFDPGIGQIGHSNNAYAMGYWQDERYFSEYREYIRQDFTLRNCLSEANKKIVDQIRAAGASVAVHIRRLHGISANHDPESNAVKERPGSVLPLQYYFDAAREVDRHVSNPTYFLFSDCPLWTAEHVKLEGRTFTLPGGRAPDYEDIILMSMCRHHIIANSSFSWWGAWLADSHGQLVIAPQCAPAHTPNIPDFWIKA